MTADPRPVTILLCTFNGARFLPALLASLVVQTHENWALWISDDGSTDDTLEVCRAFRDQYPQWDIRLVTGPQKGAAANFLSLLCHPDLPEGLVALSDQDDIWLTGKLERALRQMTGKGPVIYSAQSRYIDAAGQNRGRSQPPSAQPEFATAMLQNVLAGHSMVLNPDAMALVRRAGVVTVPFHDWWLTLLVTACGGRAVMDRQAVLLYRQHEANVLGAPGGWRAGMRRARAVWGQDYRHWVGANVRALLTVPGLLAPQSRAVVEAFVAAPSGGGPRRLALLWRLGLRRQGWRATVLVYLAALFGRI